METDFDIISDMFDTVYDDKIESNKNEEYYIGKAENILQQIEEDKAYVIKKLDISKNAFNRLMNSEVKSFHDYETYFDVIKTFRYPIKIACKINILPIRFYEKYLNII